MTVLRTLVAFAAAAMLAGCLPVTTKTPVGTTAGLAADPALFGSWKGKNPEDKQARDGYFHFMRAKDGSLTVAVAMAEGGSDDGWSVFAATSARLGSNRYLNATMTFDQDAAVEGPLKGTHFPVLYTIKAKTLTLYLLDEDKAAAAIKAGRIAGTIAPGAAGDVVITAGAQELDAFMAKPEARALFKVLMVLRRVS